MTIDKPTKELALTEAVKAYASTMGPAEVVGAAYAFEAYLTTDAGADLLRELTPSAPSPAWYPDNFRVPPAVGPFKGLRCSVTRPDLPAFPCTQPAGHEGFHEDDMGATWARTSTPKPKPCDAPVVVRGAIHRCVLNMMHGGPHSTQQLTDTTMRAADRFATDEELAPIMDDIIREDGGFLERLALIDGPVDPEDFRAAQVAADVRAQHATPDTAELHAHGLEERACPSQFQAGSEGHIVDCGEPAGHPGQHIGRRHAGGWNGVLRRWTDQQAWEEPAHPDGVGTTVQEALIAANHPPFERCATPPPNGAYRLRCALTWGHAGNHEDIDGGHWQQDDE